MARKVYVDLGANHGHTVRRFKAENPSFIVFAFEPTPSLADKLRQDFKAHDSNVHVMEYAAWITDGIVNFYFGTASDQSSTVLIGKRTSPNWSVNYELPYRAQSIDLDRWLRENTSEDDLIVLKMDIEGAEYKVLKRLLDTGMLKRISDLRVEWHWNRYPLEITEDQHNEIRHAVAAATKLTDWE